MAASTPIGPNQPLKLTLAGRHCSFEQCISGERRAGHVQRLIAYTREYFPDDVELIDLMEDLAVIPSLQTLMKARS